MTLDGVQSVPYSRNDDTIDRDQPNVEEENVAITGQVKEDDKIGQQIVLSPQAQAELAAAETLKFVYEDVYKSSTEDLLAADKSNAGINVEYYNG